MLVLIGLAPLRHLLAVAAVGVVFQIVTLVQPMPAVSLGLVAALVLLIGYAPRDLLPRGEARA